MTVLLGIDHATLSWPNLVPMAEQNQLVGAKLVMRQLIGERVKTIDRNPLTLAKNESRTVPHVRKRKSFAVLFTQGALSTNRRLLLPQVLHLPLQLSAPLFYNLNRTLRAWSIFLLVFHSLPSLKCTIYILLWVKYYFFYSSGFIHSLFKQVSFPRSF